MGGNDATSSMPRKCRRCLKEITNKVHGRLEARGRRKKPSIKWLQLEKERLPGMEERVCDTPSASAEIIKQNSEELRTLPGLKPSTRKTEEVTPWRKALPGTEHPCGRVGLRRRPPPSRSFMGGLKSENRYTSVGFGMRQDTYRKLPHKARFRGLL